MMLFYEIESITQVLVLLFCSSFKALKQADKRFIVGSVNDKYDKRERITVFREILVNMSGNHLGCL